MNLHVCVCACDWVQVAGYQEHMLKKKTCDDGVVRATWQFMALMRDTIMFETSTKVRLKLQWQGLVLADRNDEYYNDEY